MKFLDEPLYLHVSAATWSKCGKMGHFMWIIKPAISVRIGAELLICTVFSAFFTGANQWYTTNCKFGVVFESISIRHTHDSKIDPNRLDLISENNISTFYCFLFGKSSNYWIILPHLRILYKDTSFCGFKYWDKFSW